MRSTSADPEPDLFLTRAFAPCLPAGRLAGPLRAYRSVASTQLLARRWAEAGAPEGAVVVADHQTEGRGRRGRRWSAPPGAALLFSTVLRPTVPVARWPEIPLAAGCAVAEALEDVSEVVAVLKWPNDVLVDGRKVAGILAEGVAGASPVVIVGMGINVAQRPEDWPADLAARAASLAELGAVVSRERLLTACLARLGAWYGTLLDQGFEAVRAAWRRRGLLGARVDVPGGEGIAVDLGSGGELVVRRNDGRMVLLVATEDGAAGHVVAGVR
jgi:BirA family biotin operon repressor/biotin-[acetyl-CoA-carboxylase] ligase